MNRTESLAILPNRQSRRQVLRLDNGGFIQQRVHQRQAHHLGLGAARYGSEQSRAVAGQRRIHGVPDAPSCFASPNLANRSGELDGLS
jgi:hypothetical protein